MNIDIPQNIINGMAIWAYIASSIMLFHGSVKFGMWLAKKARQ
jgi:hypothetical protein